MSDAVTQARITFLYTPEDPDTMDNTGMSAREYDELMSKLLNDIGAEDVQIERVG